MAWTRRERLILGLAASKLTARGLAGPSYGPVMVEWRCWSLPVTSTTVNSVSNHKQRNSSFVLPMLTHARRLPTPKGQSRQPVSFDTVAMATAARPELLRKMSLFPK